MTEHEMSRFTAWARELRAVHERLRHALRVAQSGIGCGSDRAAAMRDLLVFCHGFCVALDGHHRAEDRTLFPAIQAAYPALAPVLRALEQDHSMIAHLLTGLRDAVDRAADPAELERHLDGIGAIMESHFRYEERQLLTVLETLDIDVSPSEAFGSF